VALGLACVVAGLALRAFLPGARGVALIGYAWFGLEWCACAAGASNERDRIFLGAIGVWAIATAAYLATPSARALFRRGYRRALKAEGLRPAATNGSPFLWIPIALAFSRILSVVVLKAPYGLRWRGRGAVRSGREVGTCGSRSPARRDGCTVPATRSLAGQVVLAGRVSSGFHGRRLPTHMPQTNIPMAGTRSGRRASSLAKSSLPATHPWIRSPAREAPAIPSTKAATTRPHPNGRRSRWAMVLTLLAGRSADFSLLVKDSGFGVPDRERGCRRGPTFADAPRRVAGDADRVR
jgi:hypothetical protein